VPVLTVKMMPELPENGGTSVTPVPLQTNLMTFSLTRPTLQGSAGVPAPLYFQPFDPAGLPSPFQPAAGRAAIIGGEPPPTVSKISMEPPSTVGSPTGRLKRAVGFATIFARMPGFTM
jgi:hypothetical protein